VDHVALARRTNGEWCGGREIGRQAMALGRGAARHRVSAARSVVTVEHAASMRMAVLGRSGGCRGPSTRVGTKWMPYPQHFRTKITDLMIKFLGYHYRLGLNPVKSKTPLSAINKTKYGPNHVHEMLLLKLGNTD
jgi:hypothetical protein